MSLLPTPHIRALIDLALDEDDISLDITSSIFFGDHVVQASLVAKEDLVLAGARLVELVFERIDTRVKWDFDADDGSRIARGQIIATATGPAHALLSGERTALNFLQRMSGVATTTARYVDAIRGSKTRVTDTRKTVPGWRELDKYAVRVGGGSNHRFSLAGGAMVKDNHIVAAGSAQEAVRRVREVLPHTLKIEVEVSSFSELEDALKSGAEIIMLDNMSTADMKVAIEEIRRFDPGIIVEASGNVTIERLPELADIGLDVVSVGALTHSVRAADISMKLSL